MIVDDKKAGRGDSCRKVKISLYGDKTITKKVTKHGNNGQVSLPPSWVGAQIKVVRL